MEPLEVRIQMAVTAAYVPFAETLSVFGDALDNQIVVSRDAAGKLLVNGGAVKIVGGTPTVANTALINVFGLGGNDNISLNEANGALPAADLFGGAGNDVLTGGSGNDFLFGGDGNDALTGGSGDDQTFGQSGNDRMIWNPGDDTDLNEGGDGIDTVEVNGGNGAEQFTVTPNGSRVRFDRVNPAPFSIDIGTSENLVLNANGGDDSFVASNGLATLINLTVDGGAGNDSITGGDGNDFLLGGDGDDRIIGGRGNDTALLGAGDDTFVWNPGDASDIVEGQDGADTLQFNGANIGETFEISANGSRVRFTRDVGNVTMDLGGTENLNLAALGGADTLTVNDLSGTDLTQANVDLGFNGAGDGAADSLIVNGTNGNDNVQVTGSGSAFSVTGLHTAVNAINSEGALDSLVVAAQGGNDGVAANTLPGSVVKLTLDGGTGNDAILGSQGNDLLVGGDGNDFVDGNQGSDVALLGAGDDIFQWDPGDGSDVVEGQDGADALQFNGANIAEKIDVSANGSRVRFTRDIGNVVMDLNGVETTSFRALGGADTVNLDDVTGTDLTLVNVNLAGPVGGGDEAADAVTVNGTLNPDSINVSGSGSSFDVTGLAAALHVVNAEADLDTLTVAAQQGDDNVNASSLQAGVVGLTENGGDGNDLLVGSQGDDLVLGGRGNDTAVLGAGDDTFVWNPGDASDVVEGQDGFDTLQFNGANIAEKFDLSANGSRLRFTRDIGNVVMDVDGTERVNVKALGGADQVTVNDLSGTDVNEVNVDLGPVGGGGDGAADNVIVSGTNGDDVAVVAGDATGVTVQGLFSIVNITNAEAANDGLRVNLQDGDDVLSATGLTADAIKLTGDGGDGNDVLIGGDGNDVLLGGNGDDVLKGGPGQDLLDGGTGDNIVIQD
jgi:Ca2+-binding RTX toxin-like protein